MPKRRQYAGLHILVLFSIHLEGINHASLPIITAGSQYKNNTLMHHTWQKGKTGETI